MLRSYTHVSTVTFSYFQVSVFVASLRAVVMWLCIVHASRPVPRAVLLAIGSLRSIQLELRRMARSHDHRARCAAVPVTLPADSRTLFQLLILDVFAAPIAVFVFLYRSHDHIRSANAEFLSKFGLLFETCACCLPSPGT